MSKRSHPVGEYGGGQKRGARKGRRDTNCHDLVVSRLVVGDGFVSKRASPSKGSTTVNLEGNFFKLKCDSSNWCINRYIVEFDPDERDKRLRKQIVRAHETTLKPYIFDGYTLLTTNLFPVDYCQHSLDKNYKFTLKHNAVLTATDIDYASVLNCLGRKCIEDMGLVEIGRGYYDEGNKILIPGHRLELWPGYKISVRKHEYDVLLGVELTHKVIRQDNGLHILNSIQRCKDGHVDIFGVKDELVGCVVMTCYNHKTYRIDDIDFRTTPAHTFEMKGRPISYIDYFRERRNIVIRDARQPMFVSRPTKKDFHRGSVEAIMLVPELCIMTGLTKSMRASMGLMRDMSRQFHMTPSTRSEKLSDFRQRIENTPRIAETLNSWGLEVDQNLIKFSGRVLPREVIIFENGKTPQADDKLDWANALRRNRMVKSVPLEKWVIIVPRHDVPAVKAFSRNLQEAGRFSGFYIGDPYELRVLDDTRTNGYTSAIDKCMKENKGKVEMVFIILPRFLTDIYTAVKKQTCIQYGIPSQCMVSKHLYSGRLIKSVCTKIAVQMNAKLGGVPWVVSIPLQNMMLVGVHLHGVGKRRNKQATAMVASTSSDFGKYFSTVWFQGSGVSLPDNIASNLRKCLLNYKDINGALPARVIMYRAGISTGQLNDIYKVELTRIKAEILATYRLFHNAPPKFTYITVTRGSIVRFAARQHGESTNPPPGTVVDDVITLPERYDFYLTAQEAREGAASPTSYNVLYDEQGLDPDKIQRLTFKTCHMYYNWTSTITIPAICQYAQKLARLVGANLDASFHEELSHLLFYL